jgi:hypothetical protein
MDVFFDNVAIPMLAAFAGAAIAILLTMLVRGGERRRLLAPALGGAVLLALFSLGYATLSYFTSAAQANARQALDARHVALTRQAVGQGSLLGCLDGLAGETVENACQAAVFATPQSVAAAVAHVGSQLTLLSDSLAYAHRFDRSYEDRVADLRRAAETDAYGIYAHVLSVRDGCNADQCAAFALLRNADTVKAHMRAALYEHRVAENSLRWRKLAPPAAAHEAVPPVAELVTPPSTSSPTAPSWTAATAVPTMMTASAAPVAAPAPAEDVSVAAIPTPQPRPAAQVSEVASVSPPPPQQLPPPQASPSPQLQPQQPRPHGVVPPIASVVPNLDFPSSQSIPPISIMSPEPRATTASSEPMPTTPTPTPTPTPKPRSSPRPE